MSTTIQGTDDLATPADQSQDNQMLQSRQTDLLSQLVVRIATLEQENKNLKATIEKMRMPQTRLMQETEQTAKKSDLRQDHGVRYTRRKLLLSTCPILNQQDGIISPIRRFDTSAFDDDKDVEEILVNTPPTDNDRRTRGPQAEDRIIGSTGLQPHRDIPKLRVNNQEMQPHRRLIGQCLKLRDFGRPRMTSPKRCRSDYKRWKT